MVDALFSTKAILKTIQEENFDYELKESFL